ncbi:MAG TPA: alpha/beta hydrolase [Gemmatimonadaceae bacterium]|jgi:hypothetical protein
MQTAHPQVLIVPGWQNSGPAHWQSLWERDNPACSRVVQSNWDEPVPEDWIATLERAIAASSGKPVLVAHSLGCVTVAHWAHQHDRGAETRLAGALLVAPADVEESIAARSLEAFAPIPLTPFRFPSILVGSHNDQYATFDRAAHLAAAWGAELVDAGRAGHINTDAGFGPWPAGEALLARLVAG